MATLTTKYSIGDVVYRGFTTTERKQHPCPDCLGSQQEEKMMERIENAFIRNHFCADTVEDAGGWIAIQCAVQGARNILSNPDKFPKANFDYLERLDLEGTICLLGAPIQYIV